MVIEQNAVEGLIVLYQRLIHRDGATQRTGIAEGVDRRISEHIVHIVGENLHGYAVGDAGWWKRRFRHPVAYQIVRGSLSLGKRT